MVATSQFSESIGSTWKRIVDLFVTVTTCNESVKTAINFDGTWRSCGNRSEKSDGMHNKFQREPADQGFSSSQKHLSRLVDILLTVSLHCF